MKTAILILGGVVFCCVWVAAGLLSYVIYINWHIVRDNL
jgi:hypothetical protein